MRKNIYLERKIYEIKKLISILEWDIPNIQNERLRAIKEGQLIQCKRELQELIEKRQKADGITAKY